MNQHFQIGEGTPVKRYFFVVQWPDREYDDFRGTLLPSDDHAGDYAARIIRELKESGAYDDPDLTMVVKDFDRKIILRRPFERLPAIEPHHAGADDDVGAGGEPVDIGANGALAASAALASGGAERSGKDEAADFLQAVLADGPLPRQRDRAAGD